MTNHGSLGMAPPPLFDRSPDLVRVWRICLDAALTEKARLEQLLSRDELERADRFHFDRDRRRFVVARGALRKILAGYLDESPEKIKFRYEERGKPQLTNPNAVLRFNISHSQEIALVAIAFAKDVGVDVEFVRPLADLEKLMEANFSARELAAVRSLPRERLQDAFFAGWTRKEAYLKALGGGLSVPLNSFSVSIIPDDQAALLEVENQPSEPARWGMANLEVGSGYAGALVAEGKDWHFDCVDWIY